MGAKTLNGRTAALEVSEIEVPDTGGQRLRRPGLSGPGEHLPRRSSEGVRLVLRGTSPRL